MAKILLAEDEAVLRMLIVDTLEDEGHEVVEAQDGQEAVEYAQREDFDLLIVDYMMPVFTGLEVIQKLKAINSEKYKNILVLSAKSQLADQSRVIDAGATHFMSKPFSPLALAEKVEDILNEN
ncbi:response regulator [Priestia flexa]|jgi:two-component system, OmpR family, phosphate regulon response regulator PhoB|uniref:Response regulator n=1 Tax=Priestia flexa TaxID=86664 RepID=A0A8I1MDZ5_9BACI|nr:response regulator [Priestia flexa]MBN8250974.1 response regulator [Priestia flexa]MBN8433192.1 response regulator [Priestia flexa]MCA0965719.1 response regulator [Priestia flexa]UIR30843.1 response regulator [Priestia flexa]UZW66290.1 response regulator [Priestia flexa]